MSRIITHKTENYTTISNHILKDKTVSLKAKAIFITIMSLPPDWNININGLCSIVKEGKSAIQSALNELIKLGYCYRTQIKNNNHFAGYLYELYEIPNTQNTYPEIQDTENRPLLNTNVLKTDSIKEKTNKDNFDLSIFTSEILKNKVAEFIEYRKEIKKPYLSQKSIVSLKQQLSKLSKNDINTSIEIINQTIANGWQGLFEIKKQVPEPKQNNYSTSNLQTLK